MEQEVRNENNLSSRFQKFYKHQNVKNFAVVLVSVLIYFLLTSFLDFGIQNQSAKYVAAAAVLMSILWITEAVPLYVTALIPIVVFPLTGVLTANDVTSSYMNSTIFLFVGGFFIAIAMEEWELHKRIAYSIIQLFKSNLPSLLFGFMSSAFLISMWISNTATALMLLPIGLAVIKNIKSDVGIHKGILLGIAYGCSIGGIATIIGTPPNLVFQRIFKISFPDKTEILFGEWIILVFPLALILLLITWFLLAKVFFKKDFDQSKNYKITITEKLSKISFEEKVVITVFSLTALLWIFRKDIILGQFVIPGWSGVLTFADYIDDSTIAVFMSILLFVIPSKSSPEKRILNSASIKKLPWEIIILFGGGFALAEGFISSGLSKILGNQLSVLSNFPIFLLVMTICLVITFLTELTSNTATAQIILPILAALSTELNINPLIVMIPAAISSSMAFMMPVATPPNAIIFSSKSITVYEMAKVGFFLNLIGALLVSTYFYLFLG